MGKGVTGFTPAKAALMKQKKEVLCKIVSLDRTRSLAVMHNP